MKISWVILTYNRSNSVTKAIPHCMANAGMRWDEVIWVDNGSSQPERSAIKHMLQVQQKDLGFNLTQCMLHTNLGVAKGYNTAMALAQGTHLVITGCDMMMPENWLRDMSQLFTDVPNMGISTIFANPIVNTPERIRGEVEMINGKRVRPAMPIERRMLSVKLQREIGYLHEGFGMYGWEDVYWAHRAEKYCKEKKLRCLNLIDKVAQHLGTEGNVGYDHKDEHEYWRWKKSQVNDPKKTELMNQLSRDGWPRFSPY